MVIPTQTGVWNYSALIVWGYQQIHPGHIFLFNECRSNVERDSECRKD